MNSQGGETKDASSYVRYVYNKDSEHTIFRVTIFVEYLCTDANQI